MNAEQLAILNLVTRLGLDAAIIVIDGIKNAKTIDDAIAALKAAQQLTIKEFRQEYQQ